MNTGAWKLALIGVVLVLLASALAPGALGGGTTNRLAVQVRLANGQPAPSNVTVSLTAPASGIRCTQTTGVGGYAFFSSLACPALSGGWWIVTVPPQVANVSSGLPPMLFLPANATVSAQYFSPSLLASGRAAAYVNGVNQLPLNITLNGNVTYGGAIVKSPVRVQLLDPQYPGFVIASTHDPTGANYTLSVPSGLWTLFSEGNVTGATTPRYNYTVLNTVGFNSSRVDRVNPSLGNFLVQGTIVPTDGVFYTNDTNLTLYDEVTKAIYSSYSTTGTPYFQMGDYVQNLGLQRFLLFVQPQGYSTSWVAVTPTSSSPTVSVTVPVLPDSAPPTQTTTVLDLNPGFDGANITSYVNMTNDSVVPTLPNATVGDLWSQIGLDFGGGVPNASVTAISLFQGWLKAAGPVYPADGMGLTVNGTAFNETGVFQFSSSAVVAPQTYNSSLGFSYVTSENYSLVPVSHWNSNGTSYYLTFDFRYATAESAPTYTFHLPAGYVLAAGTRAPSRTTLIPSGPGNTWTSFTLVPGTGGSGVGTANFTVVRYTHVTAIVNVTSSNFAFTPKNVLNSTRANYTVLVGAHQNVSFSAANSLVPAFLNVTRYSWNFGDGSPIYNTSRPTAFHYYNTTAGKLPASLTILANGGQTSTENFTVYVANLPPIPVITTNDTHAVWNGTTHTGYVYVNWSQSLRFNASGSRALIATGVSLPGILSDAVWNISAGKSGQVTNYSLSSGARVTSNLTYQFNGGGPFYNGSASVPGYGSLPLKGWLYTVLLNLWDAGGNHANATLWVLVNDTEKPVPIASVQNTAGKNITSITEGPHGGATVVLVDKYSYAPHNGTIAWYNWTVKNPRNSSVDHLYWNSTKPIPHTVTFNASLGTYNLTLTVEDVAGNRANVTIPLTVAVNYTVRPIMQASNLTAPATMQAGTTYTILVNVTNVGSNTSVAQNVSVSFYLTNQNGGGKVVLASPSSVTWYNYTKGVLNSTPAFHGLATIRGNETFRAEIRYTPGPTGTFQLWANVTASNEFPGEYISGANVAHSTVTINPNPLYQDLVYVAIGVVVVIVIVGVVLYVRRRGRGTPPARKGASGTGGRGPSPPSKGKQPSLDEDEEDED
jgi:hypothetical protein